MSDEKKIAKYEKAIRIWITELENNYRKLEKTDDPKKRNKLEEKIKKSLDHLQANVDYLKECGGSAESVFEAVSDSQKEIVKRFYATQPDRDQAEVEKEIARIKKMLHKLKEMAEEESYGRDDDIEMKMKNKLFREEAFVGYRLNRAGEKIRLSGEPNAGYNDYWKYARDYESTKDQYFTQEEQHLIQKCLESRQEEKAYLVEKRAWLGKLGSGLLETAEKISDWGEITQARVWAKNLSNEVFPQTVKEVFGNLSKAEVEKEAKEMTKRYIKFMLDPQSVERLSKAYEEAEAEAEVLRRQIKACNYTTGGLLQGKTAWELKELQRMADETVRGQNVLTLYMLKEREGLERAVFIGLYKFDPILEDRKRLLGQYSFEELGL